MEGVMMRAPHSYCVAVRKADGSMVTGEMPLVRLRKSARSSNSRWFRGVGTLCQAMKLGYRCPAVFHQCGDGGSGSGRPDAPERPAQRNAGVGNDWKPAFLAGPPVVLYKFLPLYLITNLGEILSRLRATWPSMSETA